MNKSMTPEQRRRACWRYGHLWSGVVCARCGVRYAHAGGVRMSWAVVVLLALLAVVLGAVLGHALDVPPGVDFVSFSARYALAYAEALKAATA